MGDAAEGEGRLVEQYWQYADEVRGADRGLRLVHEAGTSEASRADDRVRELVDALDRRALPLLVRLSFSAPDDAAVAFFATGPLEEWMERAGEEDLARAAAEARREPRSREATKHAVLSEQRQQLWERLVSGPAGSKAPG